MACLLKHYRLDYVAARKVVWNPELLSGWISPELEDVPGISPIDKRDRGTLANQRRVMPWTVAADRVEAGFALSIDHRSGTFTQRRARPTRCSALAEYDSPL